MKVEKVGLDVSYVNQIRQKEGNKDAEKPKEVSAKAIIKEGVEISSRDGIKRYKDAISTLPKVREEEVQALREAIEQGNYQVNSKKVGIKVLEEIFLSS